MRITGGIASGIEILSPKCEMRPALERSRIALFSSLGDISGLRTADLFAGSGAFGLEAASRGAQELIFVDENPSACKTIAANIAKIEKAGVLAKFNVHRSDVFRFIQRSENLRPGLLFLDPPYADTPGALKRLLDDDAFAKFAEAARIIVKVPDKFDVSAVVDSRHGKLAGARRFGGTDFLFVKANFKPH